MRNFNFTLQQDIKFGNGSVNMLSEIIQGASAENILLISDRGLESAGLVGKVIGILLKNNLKVKTYLDVLPNPTVAIVEEAAAFCKENETDIIIALGGGSSMDVAKAVSVLAFHGGNIKDYEGFEKVPGETLPVIAIPTTAGTGSEVTASAVITDEVAKYKYSVISSRIIPDYVLLDPDFIKGLPAKIAAATGVDAMIHAIEAYLSVFATPFTDAMAEKALELIGGNLRRFVANRSDNEAACAMLLGSTFAGIAFRGAKLGNVHAMSHPVSAYYNVPHGVANAVLLPYVLEYNKVADHGRYEKIYNYIAVYRDEKTRFNADMLIEEIRKLNAIFDLPMRLTEVGVKEDDIENMAADALKSGNVAANPRTTNFNEMVALYHKAL